MRKLFNATLFIILLAAGGFAQGTSAASPTLKVSDGTRSFNGVNELRVPAGCVTFSGRTAIISCTGGSSSGTIGSQNGNLFFASPNGAYGLPSWRAIFEADLPSISQSKVTNLASDLAAKQSSDSDLTAVAGLSSTGIMARTGAGTAAARTVTAGTGVTVTNGDGVSGNPTVAIGQVVATTSTPQFARLGLGIAADATAPLTISTKGKFSSVGSLGVNTTDADNEDGTFVGSNGGQIRIVGGDNGYGHLSMIKLLPATTGAGRWLIMGIGTNFANVPRRGNFEFYDIDTLTPRFIIDSAGRMGIGTGYVQPFSSTLTVGAGDTASLSLGGGVTWTRGAGAPAGACTSGALYTNTTTGVLSVCQSAVWVAK
jgi:hypothetical protein